MLTPLILLAIPILVIYLAREAYYRRFKKYASLPQLKPSFFWGHLNVVPELISRGPEKRHIDYIFRGVKESLGNPPITFMDFRPVSYGMCIVNDHAIAEQISRTSKQFPWSVPKSPTLGDILPVIGKESILYHEGEEWKALRRKFNPGFAPKHLMTLMPCILDKTWHFLHHLDSFARTGESFRLDELCINLTFDIIGAVTMDIDVDAQLDSSRQSELIRLYRSLTSTYIGNEARTNYIMRTIRRAKRGGISRRLDRVLKDLVQQKFVELKQQKSSNKSRSVLSLSLKDLDELDPATASLICDQLKTFLFAGHDTTSILLQWVFYELSRNPRALAAVRAELDDIFGPDPDPAVVRDSLLERGEELSGRMSYTSAVIKEALRLYPPAGSARMAPAGSGFMVRDSNTGAEYCLDGLIIYNCPYLIQRDPAVYGDTADDFVPERWLGNTDTSMNTNDDGAAAGGPDAKGHGIPPSAWRPFERGPRNCIGQELANLEARVILACTLRRYDFVKVGLGESVLDAQGQPILDDKGQYKTKSDLYNTSRVTSQPADGTVVKVKLSPKASLQLS